ncbi:MAG: hypothetical protein IKM02_02495, partial [Clostridia bacterium]|nr:hypothetical protein [Clostridia bacterium]
MLRQLHLQPAVTYVHVSSLVCKFASLPCMVFQSLAKRRLCQRFGTAYLRQSRYAVFFVFRNRGEVVIYCQAVFDKTQRLMYNISCELMGDGKDPFPKIYTDRLKGSYIMSHEHDHDYMHQHNIPHDH